MAETTDIKYRALGYFLGEAKMALGDDLKPKDIELMTTYPKRGLASIHAKMIALGKADRDVTNRIGGILDLVDDLPDGYLHPTHQGELLLGYNHYSRDMMSVKEAADRLGVSVQSVYKMLESGRLDGYKLGTKMMVFAPIVEARAK